jgi:hypothetical protein
MLAGVVSGLQDVRDDQVFVEIAPQGITRQLLWRADAQQKGRQPHIGKINLWRLDDPLLDILEVGW